MRIQAKDFPLHLKRGLSSLYLIFGEEPLHHQEAVLAIRAEAKNQGFTEREVFDVTPRFEWGSLQQCLDSPSLFSAKRLIECRLADGKIGKMGAETLIKLANTSLDQTILLITANKVEANVQSSAWFTALERKGQVVLARTLSSGETLAWLKKRCQTAGFQLNDDAMHTLVERTEGNCLAAAQFIEKLGLLYPNPHPAVLTLQNIMEIMEGDARFSLFDLVDAALEGSLSRTTRIFTSLKDEGTDPILVLWAIAREVRAIIPLARQIKAGCSEREVFSQSGVWKRRESVIGKCVQRLSIVQLHKILIQAKHVDDMLKGRLKGDGWAGIFMLLLALVGCQTSVGSGVHYG